MISILLADDHVMFREGLKQILSRYSDIHVGGEASNGNEVLTLMATTSFDVIVLDISMPGQSGWDVLSEIKRENPHQVALILSMHPEEQYAMRMLRGGAAGYISKESPPAELVAAIRKVADGGRHVSPKLAEKLAFALDSRSNQLAHHSLSNREFQVLCLLASGKTLKEIADQLFLSEKTITTYRARILDKLGLRNNVELTHYVLEHKLM